MTNTNHIMTLGIVIPCYNEEAVIRQMTNRLLELYDDLMSKNIITKDSFILYSNDGSSDTTWSLIENMHKQDKRIIGIELATNKGQQTAILAGLEYAHNNIYTDAIITMDCDGQDDIDAVYDMIDAYYDGHDIVYGVRNDRHSDTFLKRTTALTYYKILSYFDKKTIYNHADYRLMSRHVIGELLKHTEQNIYIRGLIPTIGFNSKIIYYKRNTRMAGETHYTVSKMFDLAMNGITYNSTKLLRTIMRTGILFIILSIISAITGIILYYNTITYPIWATITTIIGFFTGIQLTCMGIIAEYIGKIYIESKHRPRYTIKDTTKS